MKLSLAKGFALAALLMAANAKAGIVTIEPDDFAAGTMVTSPDAAISYVYHTRDDPYFTYRAALAAVDPSCALYPICAAPTGTHVLSAGDLTNGVLQPGGTVGLEEMMWGLPPDSQGQVQLTPERIALMHNFYALRVDFTTPTNYFSADFFGTTDPVWIFAFSPDGTFLSMSQGPVGESSVVRRDLLPGCPGYSCYTYEQTASVEHANEDIGFVFVGSYSSIDYPDAIRFNVPEPSGFALCAAGLLGLGLMRRRKLQTVST